MYSKKNCVPMPSEIRQKVSILRINKIGLIEYVNGLRVRVRVRLDKFY